MRKLLYVFICFICLCNTVSASMTPKDIEQSMKKMEKDFKLEKIIKRIKNGEIDSRKLQIVYLILQNTSEYYIHNLAGVSGNKVYIHKDGHKEAVFDKKGNLVQDGINDGSYNYFNAKIAPLKHFCFDMHPWIMWGSSKRDTTSKKERIFGYISDLEGGIRKSLKATDSLKKIQKDNWDRNGQLQALAIFMLVQEKIKSDSLFDLFEKDPSSITDKEILKTLKDLEVGFNEIY